MEGKNKNTYHQTSHHRPKYYQRGSINMISKGLMAIVFLFVSIGL